MTLNNKYLEWLKRYTGPEILGLIGAYGSILAYRNLSTTPSEITSSFIGTWGENLGYYLSLFNKDFRRISDDYPELSIGHKTFRILKGMGIEFGLAELLDSFLIRPTCLYFCIHYFGENLGILVGKFLADFFFYIPTIFFYELKKKFDV